ncbi:MAG TPA: hypothetical protein DIC19_04920 [Erysipelotrichaceae bacterium]|nr:hypothetical protein [Erysipelotrichaceae bacterium]
MPKSPRTYINNFLLGFIILFFIGSLVFLNYRYAYYKQAEIDLVRNFGVSSEVFINPVDVQSLSGSEEDLNKVNYQFLKTNLRKLKEAHDSIAFSYIMRQVDDQYIFLVDSEDPDTEGYSPPGQVYDEIDEQTENAFRLKTITVTSPETDRWGTWVSVLVPIMKQNELVGLLGLDFDAQAWNRTILNKTLNDAYGLLSILLLLILVFWNNKKSQDLHSVAIQLRDSESLFKAVFNQAPIGIATISKDSRVAMANPVYQSMIEFTHVNVVNNNWKKMSHPDDLAKEMPLFEAFLKGENDGYELIKRLKNDQDEYRWINLIIRPLFLDRDSRDSYLCILQDVHEQVKTMEALRESERSKGLLLSHLPGMAYRCRYDRDWTMEYVSPGCKELTGYDADDFIESKRMRFNDIIDDQYRDTLFNQWSQVVLKHENFKAEYEITTADGNRKWVLELGQAVYDPEGNVLALEGIIIDITDVKLRDAQIQYLDMHDVLTGTYNRKYLEIETIRTNQALYCPLVVLIADINGVRLINDAFGYKEGDQLIIQAASILKQSCGRDALVFRTGGDEFTVLIPHHHESNLHELINHIKYQVDLYNEQLDNTALNLSLSLGSAIRTDINVSIEQVMKEAVESLHKNKLLDRKSHFSSVLSSMQATMIAKSEETEEHTGRLAAYVRKMGEWLNLNQSQMDNLILLSMLHDIGKIGIPEHILHKPGKLTDEEWIIMRKHTEIGHRIALASPELHSIAPYILTHHERWDGKGYPKGIKADDIPLLARILSIVDAYDAMTQDRVYRKGMPREDAINELRRCAGSQFDPSLVDLFITHVLYE